METRALRVRVRPGERPAPIRASASGPLPQMQAKLPCLPSARPVGSLGAAPGPCQHRADQQKSGITDHRWPDFPKRDTSPVNDSRPKGTPSLPKARHYQRGHLEPPVQRRTRPPADPGRGRPRHRLREDRKAKRAPGKHRPQEAESASLGKARPLESQRRSTQRQEPPRLDLEEGDQPSMHRCEHTYMQTDACTRGRGVQAHSPGHRGSRGPHSQGPPETPPSREI